MSSDIELFRKKPYPGGVGAKLSAIPLKRNMQDPANQEAAANAWAAHRKRLGVPAADQPEGFQDNMARASRELGREFWGMPEERILEILSERADLAGPLTLRRWANQPLESSSPAFAQPDKNMIVMPGIARDQAPERRLGILLHEARHLKAKQDYPTFMPDHKNQGNAKAYDLFGNQPKHFPAEMGTDRQVSEALEAAGLARDYGGYPPDVRPGNPWSRR